MHSFYPSIRYSNSGYGSSVCVWNNGWMTEWTNKVMSWEAVKSYRIRNVLTVSQTEYMYSGYGATDGQHSSTCYNGDSQSVNCNIQRRSLSYTAQCNVMSCQVAAGVASRVRAYSRYAEVPEIDKYPVHSRANLDGRFIPNPSPPIPCWSCRIEH